MKRSDTLLFGAGCFLAGIGATGAAAWALERAGLAVERTKAELHLRMVTPSKLERTLRDLEIASAERFQAEGHIRALLREPRVSKSDHKTDRRAAEDFLRRRDPGQG